MDTTKSARFAKVISKQQSTVKQCLASYRQFQLNLEKKRTENIPKEQGNKAYKIIAKNKKSQQPLTLNFPVKYFFSFVNLTCGDTNFINIFEFFVDGFRLFDQNNKKQFQ